MLLMIAMAGTDLNLGGSSNGGRLNRKSKAVVNKKIRHFTSKSVVVKSYSKRAIL